MGDTSRTTRQGESMPGAAKAAPAAPESRIAQLAQRYASARDAAQRLDFVPTQRP